MKKDDQIRSVKESDIDRCLDAMLIVIKERDRAIELLRDIFAYCDGDHLSRDLLAEIAVILYNHGMRKY